MLQNPPLASQADPSPVYTAPAPAAPVLSTVVPNTERFDLDLLVLQKIESDIHRGLLKLQDPRRYMIAASFIKAAVREMKFACARPPEPAASLSLRLGK